MKLIVKQTKKLAGEIIIPPSKSHTIRAVIIASLASGVSKIENPLVSEDTVASIRVCESLGAKITRNLRVGLSQDVKHSWTVEGFGGHPHEPKEILDFANSGTTLSLISGVVSLGDFEATLDGDDSLRTRPMQPLLDSLSDLGAKTLSIKNNGKCPLKIRGPINGGKTKINGMNSQFVSSLLISAPLAKKDTIINVVNLNEVPYIRMTLEWLKFEGIKVEKKEDLTYFKIKGNQKYKPFKKNIPSDWSSAAFPLVASLITKSDILLKGLDIKDVQGDKAIIKHIEKMGAKILFSKNGIKVQCESLKGIDIDLNEAPDALPALAVLACHARGKTKLYNVASARIKETDRIKVMALELKKMGAKIEELPDGLIIYKSKLKGTKVNGHNDHRIVMALGLAGIIAKGITEIDTAESVSVTYPTYVKSMKALGASMEVL